MYNAKAMGETIKALRKEHHISQEKMALDLNMYQPDISNLEHAENGSGISDIYKIELIAEYFGVTLVDLITASINSSISPQIKSIKQEVYQMKNYVISEVKFGKEYFTGLEVCASELKLTAPNGMTTYVSFSDLEGMPIFYETPNSIFDVLLLKRNEIPENIEEHTIIEGNDYIDIFLNADPEWIDIFRYLIFVGTENEEEVSSLIAETKGKAFKDIIVPHPECEPDMIINPNCDIEKNGDVPDQSIVFRYRLMFETLVKNPTVFDEVDNNEEVNKAILDKLINACQSETTYQSWKTKIIDEKVAELSKKEIVVCDFVFAGMGTYHEIMPKEEVESFKCFINTFGSAIFAGSRKATKRDIKKYVKLHIADGLIKKKNKR